MLWALVLLVVGPCAYQQAPLEMARWHVAAAIKARSEGRQEAALDLLDRALAWDADNPSLYLKRAQWRKADGQYDLALADVQRADALRPDDPRILSARSELLQLLGKHAEAIEIWRAIDRLSLAGGTPPRETALNGLAYAQAVGNLELEEGLERVNKALDIEPDNAALLDTRGFLLYRLGKYDEALRDMEAAVQGMEHELRLTQAVPATMERIIFYSDNADGQMATAKQAAAVIRYHRALVLERLGRHAEAKADRARARVLIGRDPDETLF
jgi:tetratricopeptide (TPR) repeat protein